MPTYDYECQKCKHRFEIFQSMKDDPIKKCVKCGGKVKKMIGAGVGIIFKGSGFYVNDYKKSNSCSDNTSKPKSSKPSSSSESKSEAVSNSKAE